MDWDQSLNALYNFKSEADFFKAGAQPLIDVVENYLEPPDITAAENLKARWKHKVDGVPTNILGIACANFIKDKKYGKIREDGSPSIVHEFSQIYYLTSFEYIGIELDRPDLVACISALHDICEDFDVTPDEISDYLMNWIDEYRDVYNLSDETVASLQEDVKIIVDGVYIMSRFIKGHKDEMNKFEYIGGTLLNPLTAIAKPLDRLHNISTLEGGKKAKDISKKLRETRLLFMTPIYEIPGIEGRFKYFDAAALRHPQNKKAYEFLSTLIGTALDMHNAHKVNRSEAEKTGDSEVVYDPKKFITQELRDAALPRVIRPLQSLSNRAHENHSFAL